MSRKLKMGVVGLGMGRGHARGYQSHPGSELVAVCDQDEKRLKEVAAELGVAQTYTDSQFSFCCSPWRYVEGISMKAARWALLSTGLLYLVFAAGCGYRYYTGPLKPATAAGDIPERVISDDGTVTFVQGRLEISVRPMTDEELNRQFPGHSGQGISSTNPYTFGGWMDPELGKVPSRFTIFRLKVKNYMYPKMLVDPMAAVITAQNGREYSPLDLSQLEQYYLKYVTGYAGNQYANYKERMGLLRSSIYPGDHVFSGQEEEGFIVFPLLHPDVRRIHLRLRDVVLRFDILNEPKEQMDVEYVFERDTGRILPDGQISMDR